MFTEVSRRLSINLSERRGGEDLLLGSTKSECMNIMVFNKELLVTRKNPSTIVYRIKCKTELNALTTDCVRCDGNTSAYLQKSQAVKISGYPDLYTS